MRPWVWVLAGVLWAGMWAGEAQAGVCGDGVVDAGEQCDGEAGLERGCVGWGYFVGVLGCAPDCSLDTQQCLMPQRWTQVASNFQDDTCALTLDGSVRCWGDLQGQEPRERLTQFSLEHDYDRACGLSLAGEIVCWGEMKYWKEKPPTGSFTKLSMGHKRHCAIRTDGELLCWGDELGTAPNIDAPAGTRWADVSVSNQDGQICAIDTEGTLRCDTSIPWTTSPSGTWSKVKLGTSLGCAVRSGGEIACWGIGTHKVFALRDIPFEGVVQDFVPMSDGVCIARDRDKVWCWSEDKGIYEIGALLQTINDTSGLSPVREIVLFGDSHKVMTPLMQQATQVRALSDGGCLRTLDGKWVCWRNNNKRALDASSTDFYLYGDTGCSINAEGKLKCWDRYRDITAKAAAQTFVAVEASPFHVCALGTDQLPRCWSISNDVSSPAITPAVAFAHLSVDEDGVLGLRPDGGLAYWDHDTGRIQWPFSKTYVSVALGEDIDCAVSKDGQAECGNFNTKTPYDPTKIPAGPFQQVAVDRHLHIACGLRDTGHIVCWGDDIWSITEPLGQETFTQLSLSPYGGGCALHTSGVPMCWGHGAISWPPFGR